MEEKIQKSMCSEVHIKEPQAVEIAGALHCGVCDNHIVVWDVKPQQLLFK